MSDTVIEIETADPDADLDGAARIRRTARTVFGWDPLRPGLARAVEEVLGGHDVLGVMPTGYGKSAVYRLAGHLLSGTTLVVSPLIALQADQIRSLAKTPGARPAALVNSSQGDAKNEAAWAALDEGRLGYLFLAPERLADDEVLARLAAARISLFAVDEAHCVSSWGHDFRPDYLRLGDAAEALGRPPVLALTATGSGPVREEIVERLRMRDAVVLTHGFDRPNISLRVARHVEEDAKVAAVLDEVAAFPQPGLLYVATRRTTESYAGALAERGLRAVAYHAGLGAKRRRELHARFAEGEYDVVVATSAFGMGIDKADIRYVVHAAIPESLDEYYQELGRAGRDGEPSIAVLHYRPEDLALRVFFRSAVPKPRDLARFLDAATDDVDGAATLDAVATGLEVSVRRATSLAYLLEDAGALTLTDGALHPAPDVEPERAVEAAIETATARRRIDESRLAMIRGYAETQQCRRQYLLAYFGEEAAEPCGNCDTCDAGSASRYAEERASAGDDPFPVDAAVRHREWGPGTVMSTEEDRITVFFESEGYRVLSLAAVAQHELLERV